MAVRTSDCGHLTITCDLQVSASRGGESVLVGQNVRVRALLIGIIVILVALTGGAVGGDFGTAIYAEYRLSRANGVDRPIIGEASFEATMYSIDLTQASWLVRPGAPLPVDKAEGRVIIDSTHLGRFMGINDLLVEAPPKETNDATGGTTESGISSSIGLVFTGTPKVAGFKERVSVSVDLSMTGPDDTTLVFTATGILTGPATADRKVPDDKLDAVLAAFSKRLPGQKLPFGIAPSREGARGSDVIIQGIAEGLTLRLDQFTGS